MIHRNAQPLSDILEEVLSTQHMKDKLNETTLIRIWPEVVGKNLADQTKNLYIKNGTLFIHVNSAIIRNELMLIRESLIKKLNTEVGANVIRQIVLR